MTDPKTDLCYPVLTPFKLGRVVVKPPAFVQMSAAEAREYQDAGVLGGEDDAALPPEPATHDDPETPAPFAAEPAAVKPVAAAVKDASPAKPAAKAKKAAAKKAAK